VLQSSRPDFDATWSAGLSTTVEPPPPSHSDLVALQYDVAALPALLLLSPNGTHVITKLSGERELVAHGLCLDGVTSGESRDWESVTSGESRDWESRDWESRDWESRDWESGGGASASGAVGGALTALLTGESTSREVASSRAHEARRREGTALMSRLPELLCESSVEWLCQCGWRLLLVNVEGTLKKPGGLSMPPVAPSRAGANDAFRSDALPLLSGLLVCPGECAAAHGEDTDGHAAHASMGTSVARGEELREGAPHLALLTDLGHQVSERASGAELLDEQRVRRVLDELLVRLANELHLSPNASRQLAARTRVYHNFTPLSVAEPTEAAKAADPRLASAEWTHSWCRPNPGQLLEALKDYDVPASEALMVCVHDRDEEAADAAGVASITLAALLSGTPHEHVCMPGQRAHRRNGKAPASFAMRGALA
jgi:hypothetical protein